MVIVTDAARAHDNGGLTGVCAALIGRMETDRQRLDERALQCADVFRQLEAERGLMRHILLKNAVSTGGVAKNTTSGLRLYWPSRQNLQWPQVLPGSSATRSPTLRCLDLTADLYDRTARLMAQNERRFDHNDRSQPVS